MNKRVAPTVILIIVVFFILVQTAVLIYAFAEEGLGIFWKLIIALVPLGIIVALIGVYRERIREIKEQDEEDLSKY